MKPKSLFRCWDDRKRKEKGRGWSAANLCERDRGAELLVAPRDEIHHLARNLALVGEKGTAKEGGENGASGMRQTSEKIFSMFCWHFLEWKKKI